MGPGPAATEEGQGNKTVKPDCEYKGNAEGLEEGRLQSHSSVALTSTVIIITS